MNKLALGLIYYNARPELERLLNSLPSTSIKSIDVIIAIDGIFRYNREQNPHLPLLSNDGSTKLLRDSAYDVKIINAGGQTEFYKRNRYLEMCQKLDVDYLLIVDSDEYFTYAFSDDCKKCGDKKRRVAWQKFRTHFEKMTSFYYGNHNVFTMWLYDPETGTSQQQPRCWYNPGEMRYISGSHYHFANMIREKATLEDYEVRKLMYSQDAFGCIDGSSGLFLTHDHSLRTKEQLQQHNKYQQWLLAHETLMQNPQH